MKQTDTWREARRLHALGFAIHWLKPNSKRPVESGWTTGDRKDWAYLRDTYQPNYNVGVRLGSVSHIPERGYLTVIDVDIKSPEPRHRKEAEAALTELVGSETFPEVRSGFGNGSRHLYCVTPKPFKTWDPAVSPESIRAQIPSKPVSKREREELSEEELNEGWRLVAAWQISLYSEGRQVVLPPSTHPDTGKPYRWKEPFTDVEELPLAVFGQARSEPEDEGELDFRSKPQEVLQDFKIDETLDVRWLPDLAEPIRSLIVTGMYRGQKVSDRSAYLLPAATGLVSAGLDRNEVLTVLTDPSTYLGECAYDHAQTKSRSRAAQWLWNYTVKKVMEERDPVRVFKDISPTRAVLGKDEASAQAESFEEERNWRQELDVTEKGKFRNTFNNCQIILTRTAENKAVLGRDEFAVNDFFLCNTSWGAKKGQAVTDDTLIRFKKFCVDQFGIEFAVHLVNEVFSALAGLQKFHPVRDYLRGLKWDGKPRIETWLSEFAGASGPEEYLKAVSRKTLVALVKRVFEPGCKFDHVLILEGLQGSGKSTLLENLTTPWFTDEKLNIGDKDAVLTMQSKWLVELGELSTIRGADLESLKAFISRRTDRIRAPYGKRVEEFPRQCVFIGSTNQDEYLPDETGNRRFWPVKCGAKVHFEELAKARDQFFAEAYAFYQLGEPVYLETAELNQLAEWEQVKRGETDEWLAPIRDLVMAEGFPIYSFEMRDVTKSMDAFGANRLSPWDQRRVAKCLRTLKFEKFQETKGHRRKLWRATDRLLLTLDKMSEKGIGTAEGPIGTERNLSQGSRLSSVIADFY